MQSVTLYIRVSGEFAVETQHALMGAISPDWSLEVNLALIDGIKSIQSDLDAIRDREIPGTYEYHLVNHKDSGAYSTCANCAAVAR